MGSIQRIFFFINNKVLYTLFAVIFVPELFEQISCVCVYYIYNFKVETIRFTGLSLLPVKRNTLLQYVSREYCQRTLLAVWYIYVLAIYRYTVMLLF